jgi:hypothetical protein
MRLATPVIGCGSAEALVVCSQIVEDLCANDIVQDPSAANIVQHLSKEDRCCHSIALCLMVGLWYAALELWVQLWLRLGLQAPINLPDTARACD